ncbi:MAG: type I polyketide synthase, partial [Desulfuromusa sp.]|nr:type I polyketide synthase [Desulfuromusa sp.]
MVTENSVAIIGVGGIFPKSPTLGRFWDNIAAKVDTARQPPEGRWLLPVSDVYNPQVGVADKVYSQKGCFIDTETDPAQLTGLDIDPDFLAQLDPMFRLLLRVGQQTISSVAEAKINASRSGIIIGNLALPSEKSSALARHYLGRTFLEKLSPEQLSFADSPVAPINHYVAGLPAGLLAKALGFEGSCFTVDAACASSLYAIKLAVDELKSGRADTMLAGGLSRPDSLYTQMGFSQLRALSPNGICSPFDRDGNGLVVGEGCGLVLLKRTRDALRDGDKIHAVIRGIGLSNDLGGSLLAPAAEGQLRAMRAAYQQAGWSPGDVDLIECHATGTPVGDAVEFSSLQQLWQEHDWRSGQCVIGSVKANIGHLLTAAGAAATLKTVLAMGRKILPPMPNFKAPAEGIDLEHSPFRILQQGTPWNSRKDGLPRRAGVSAFGFGGINAHLLLEEWVAEKKSKSPVRLHPSFKQRTDPVAIVGMGAQFGPWKDLTQFQQHIFSGGDDVAPQLPENWWGVQESYWYQGSGLDQVGFKGFFIPTVFSSPGDFRIPPKEQEEMLPRQLLMLKVAAAALLDAQMIDKDLLFTGVFIGTGLDLNATNFSFRWGVQKYARQWAEELGLQLNEEEFLAWVEKLRDATGPPLTANRTMGALGSVVASRIAKEFRIGGPSFTLSSEENSGLRALEVAIHSLQEGAINRAIVGAVDLAGDLRSVISRYEMGASASDGTDLIGEGAAAVVLKRLEDARQDGDRIYAVIKGTGSAIGGRIDTIVPEERIYSKSVELACRSGNVAPESISYLEVAGGHTAEMERLEAQVLVSVIGAKVNQTSCKIGNVRRDIGFSGAASGLASLVKTALCLEQKILPPLRNPEGLIPEWLGKRGNFFAPGAAQYWLHNRKDGLRRALVCGIGADSSCSHLVLEEFAQTAVSIKTAATMRPLGPLKEGLFVIEAANSAELLARIEQLKTFATDHSALNIDALAQLWFQRNPLDLTLHHCLSLVSTTREDLVTKLDHAEQTITVNPDRSIGVSGAELLPPALREQIFYSAQPLGTAGKIAFMFPGSGNQFAGMGRELSVLWPEVYRQQDQYNDYLADQYLPDHFWRAELAESIQENHNALVISHVAQCTALSDLLSHFGIKPQMISGYSLGESAGLFSSGAWRDRDGMLQRLEKSPLFTHELAGECRAAKRTWGLKPNQPVDWVLGMINLPAEPIKQYLQGKKQVYLLIINTHRESVVGGQRRQIEKLVADLGCHFIPLQGVTTVHCEVTKAVADAYRKLHLFPVTLPGGIDFYSCALGRKYPLTSDHAADVILAQALDTIDYPRVIEQLYADGARIFLEVGPGTSCSRMIHSILENQPHLTRSICAPGQDEAGQLLRLLGSCLAERVEVDLNSLYPPLLNGALPVDQEKQQIFTTIGGKAFNLEEVDQFKKTKKTVTYNDNVKPSD